MLLLDVTRDFSICVDELTKNEKHGFLTKFRELGISQEEAQRLAREHWARKSCLNNICSQISAYEMKFKGKASRDGRKKLIAVASQLYLSAIIEHRRQENLTALQKSQIVNRDSLQNDVASLIKEVPSGADRNQM